jgi:hypothetical protein
VITATPYSSIPDKLFGISMDIRNSGFRISLRRAFSAHAYSYAGFERAEEDPCKEISKCTKWKCIAPVFLIDYWRISGNL